MLKKKDKLEVPREDRIFIDPKTRLDLFPNLVENFKIYFPNLKIIYAFLNRNANNPIDFVIIMEDVDKGFVLWDAPHIYTNRCMPAYLYVVKNNLYTDYFNTVKDYLCSTRTSKFSQFITMGCNLSLDKNSDLYWKKPENSDEFIKNLIDLSIEYRPA